MSLISDPRSFHPFAVAAKTPVTVSAVPGPDGGLLRLGRNERSGKPFAQISFQVVAADDADIVGAICDLVLWPSQYLSSRFFQLLSCLTGSTVNDLAAAGRDGRLGQLELALRHCSFRAEVGTDAYGCLSVDWLNGRCTRLGPGPALPDHRPRLARAVLPEAFPLPALDLEALLADVRQIADQAALEALCAEIRDAGRVGFDIETDFGPFGPGDRDLSAADGAIRLMQVAWGDPAAPAVAVVDCYQVDPAPLLALLADGREVVIHHSPFEQQWLTYHHGIGQLPRVIDTRAYGMIVQGWWARLVDGYEPGSNALGELVPRLWGIELDKSGQEAWWGAEQLDPQLLRYAALDAALLLPLAELLEILADQIGCSAQARATTAALCAQTLRRLPRERWLLDDQLLARIDAAAGPAELEREARLLRSLPLSARARLRLSEQLARRATALAG